MILTTFRIFPRQLDGYKQLTVPARRLHNDWSVAKIPVTGMVIVVNVSRG